MENYRLDCRKSFDTSICSFTKTHYQNAKAGKDINEFEPNFPLWKSFSIETLLKEIRPVVEKKGFAYLVESKLLAVFGMFGPSEIWANDQSKRFPNQSSARILRFLIETLIKEVKPVVT